MSEHDTDTSVRGSLLRCQVYDNGVARVDLDSPVTRNALSDDLVDALLETLGEFRDRDDVRVVVIGSTHPRVFSAGGDLKAFADDTPYIRKYDRIDRFPRLYRLIGALGKPVICAVNGDVLAGSFGLALACDFIIASESARFACPEINVGVFPFMISALIFRSVSRVKAHEMMMLGRRVSAIEAERLGFVNTVVSDADFESTVAQWSSELAAKSPLLMRMGKNALNATRDADLDSALDQLQAQLALAFTTEDMKEGVAAFLAKREPIWSMR